MQMKSTKSIINYKENKKRCYNNNSGTLFDSAVNNVSDSDVKTNVDTPLKYIHY